MSGWWGRRVLSSGLTRDATKTLTRGRHGVASQLNLDDGVLKGLKTGKYTNITGKDGSILRITKTADNKFMTTNLRTGSTREYTKKMPLVSLKEKIVEKAASNTWKYAGGAGALGLGYLAMGGDGSESEKEVYVENIEEGGYTNVLTGETFNTREELEEDKNSKKLRAYLILALLIICSIFFIGGAFVLFSSSGKTETISAPSTQTSVTSGSGT